MDGSRHVTANRGIVSFGTLAILMLVVIVAAFMFLNYAKFQLTLVVKDTYDFNRHMDAPLALYNLRVNTANGCDSSKQICDVPLVFELNSMNFLNGANKDTVTKNSADSIFGKYNAFMGKVVQYYFSLLGPGKTVCLTNGAIKENNCNRLSNYDLGLVYPVPLVPNGNFKTNPSAMLTEMVFQIKG